MYILKISIALYNLQEIRIRVRLKTWDMETGERNFRNFHFVDVFSISFVFFYYHHQKLY
jgi:hypothetical protein